MALLNFLAVTPVGRASPRRYLPIAPWVIWAFDASADWVPHMTIAASTDLLTIFFAVDVFMHTNNTQVLKKVNTPVVCRKNTFVLGFGSMRLTYGERLRAARKNKKLTQPRLAEISSVGQGTISKIERGDQDNSAYDVELAFCLDVHPMWLKNGDERFIPKWLANPTKIEKSVEIDSNAEWAPGIEEWDESTPLPDDEVALPFFREIELSAGNGRFEVIENHGAKLRFAKSTLKKHGVNISDAACVTVSGNSMDPVIPHGTTVGIDTSYKKITDGEIYAINHDGNLRVKSLYALPGGGIRIRSYNREEYPDEILSAEQAADVLVLGWVFWWSVIRKRK